MRAAVVPDTPVVDQAANILPHGASIGALVMTFMGWLPAIVAIVPALYYGLLIYESKTVQGWLKRRRAKKRLKRIHKLRSKRHSASA